MPDILIVKTMDDKFKCIYFHRRFETALVCTTKSVKYILYIKALNFLPIKTIQIACLTNYCSPTYGHNYPSFKIIYKNNSKLKTHERDNMHIVCLSNTI